MQSFLSFECKELLYQIHGAEWGRTFRVFFCISRLNVHSDGLFVLLDLTNIIKLESGEKEKS